jgi:hypothetical protein
MAERGLSIPPDSISITHTQRGFELQCVIVGHTVTRVDAMTRIVSELSEMPDIESFTVTHSSRA